MRIKDLSNEKWKEKKKKEIDDNGNNNVIIIVRTMKIGNDSKTGHIEKIKWY